MSLRDQLLSGTPHSLAVETVEVPEWEATFEVRSMSAGTQMRLAPKPGEDMDFTEFYFGAIVACCFDPETGERVFADDIARKWLEDQAPEPVRRLSDASLRVSGLEAKAVDEGKGDS